MSSIPDRNPLTVETEAETEPEPSGTTSVVPSPRAATSTSGAATPASGEGALWSLVRRLHFYAGVFIAPFLAVAALTGFAYAFAPQLDTLVHGDELRVERVSGTPRPLAAHVTAARAANPRGSVVRVIPPADRKSTTAVVFSVPALGEKQRTVYVDPYTGRVKGALTTSFDSTPVTTWLGELHASLHMGAFGRLYSELAASWLWIIVGGGLLLWLGRRRRYVGRGPARRVLWPDRSARGVRRTRGRHAVTGLWAAVVLLFLSATGLTWSDHAGARFDKVQGALRAAAPELNTAKPAAFTTDPGTGAAAGTGAAGTGAGPAAGQVSGPGSGAHQGHDTPDVGTAGAVDPAAQVDGVLAVARRAGLSGPVKIGLPEDVHSVWSVTQADNRWPVRRDKIAVDADTGQVTARVDWAEHPWPAKLSALGIQFHMGILFGVANQVLLAATALALPLVILWGYRMWWQRRPTRPDRRLTRTDGGLGRGLGRGPGPVLGRPPARGAWRRLPRPVLVAGLLVVPLVGWALPVFGVTLLGFLAVDAVLAVVSRRRDRAVAGRTA